MCIPRATTRQEPVHIQLRAVETVVEPISIVIGIFDLNWRCHVATSCPHGAEAIAEGAGYLLIASADAPARLDVNAAS
jgi:hypothetical protein